MMTKKISIVLLSIFFKVVNSAGGGYNDTCPVDSCDNSLFLECKDGRCLCFDTSVYIDSLSECRLKAGNVCQLPPIQECVPYSDCKTENGGSDLNCICKSNVSASLPSGLCPKLSHGENCAGDGEDLCDESKFLQCGSVSQVCECKNKNNTIFDENTGACRVLVGESCGDNAVVDKDQDCVERSVCFNNVCACRNDRFEVNPERQCTIPFGDVCDDENPCYEDNHQECRSGRCACANYDDTYFDPKDKTCYLLHGTSCSSIGNPKCAPNSDCYAGNNTCQCEVEFHPSENRRCALGYNQRCNVSNNFCDELQFLECNANSSKCDCQLKSETIYEPITQKCELLANAPCIPGGPQKCILDSSCKAGGSGILPFTCQCNVSLEANKNRQCFLPHNSSCDILAHNKCDRAAFLECNNNRCQCERSDMEYVTQDKSCFINPDGQCSNIGENNPMCGKNAYCSTNNICVCQMGFESTGRGTCLRQYGQTCSSSECNYYKNVQCVDGVCGCVNGNIPGATLNGTECFSGYRQLCSSQINCYSSGYLICVSGMCDCLSSSEQKYFPSLQKCLSLPDMRCNVNAQDQEVALHCVEKAFCVPDKNNSNYGKCQCAQEYDINFEGDACIAALATFHFTPLLPPIIVAHFVRILYYIYF